MIDFITPLASLSAALVEVLGVVIITVTALLSLASAALKLYRQQPRSLIYHELRQFLGRGILLGLEFLIAADIIYTVAVELSFSTIGVLAIVILIRTFLSFTLELELKGRWPWQSSSGDF